MKMTIDISDEEITREVKRVLVQKLAEQIFEQRNSFDKHGYQRMLKEAVKDLLAGRVEEMTDQAAKYAADYIGKRGVRRILGKLGEASGQ